MIRRKLIAILLCLSLAWFAWAQEMTDEVMPEEPTDPEVNLAVEVPPEMEPQPAMDEMQPGVAEPEPETMPGALPDPDDAETDYQLLDSDVPSAEEPDVTEFSEIDLSDIELFIPDNGVDSRESVLLPSIGDRESAADRDSETISVDFPDEEVRTIIRNVADLYDLNVVIPDTLVGSTSLKLRNVTWRQVFEVILDPVGFTYTTDGNIIKIKSQEDLLQEPTETRVFPIDFANAGEIQASIAPLVDSAAGGRIQVDSRSNSLVITERPTRFNNIQEIIARLDRPTAQVMIESKFVEVTNRDVQNLGVNWSSLNSYRLSAGPFQRAWARDISRVLTDAGGSNRLDSTDTQNTATSDTTNTFSNTPAPGSLTTTNTTSVGQNEIIGDTNTLTRVVDLVNTATQGRMDSAVFSADAFNVILSALSTFSDAELISNPTVVTLNNTPATINIGEEFPIPQYQYNDERGTFEVSNFEFKPIGIILKVTPHVNSGGFIKLHIAAEVSSRAGTVNFGGAAAAEIPIIATRKTESTITIKDGFTLAVGGLVENFKQKSNTKVPLLGGIPGIGQLFKSKSHTTDARNLIIFITARTLNPDGSTYKDIFSPRTLYSMGIKSSEVPGYEIPASQLALYDQIQSLRDDMDTLHREQKLRNQIEAFRKLHDKGAYNKTPGWSKRKKIDW